MDLDSNRSFSLQSTFHYLILLFVAKFFKSFGIYLCNDLLKTLSIVNLLLILQIVSTALFLLLQNNPLNRLAKLSKTQLSLLFKYSFLNTCIKLCWLFGLSVCGPLRAVLIYEQSTSFIINALKTLFSGVNESNVKRSRGVLLLLVGTLILFLFDKDRLTSENDQQSGYFVDLLNLTDHKSGLVLLLIALFGQILLNNGIGMRIQVEIQPKRLQALSSATSSLILVPVAFFKLTFDHFFDVPLMSSEHSWLFITFQLLLASVFIFVINFYIEYYVSHKTSPLYTAKYGQIMIFLISLALGYLWSNHPHVVRILVGDKIKTIVEEEHAISLGVFLVLILFISATQLLSSPIKRVQGSFIGYSSNGQPLYSLTEETFKRTRQSIVNISKNIFKEIISHSDSRSIFYFLCINLTFTFVELIYGAWTNSLGLISDGFHMFFDCSALVMGLCAAVISQWKPTRIYSYGFGRIEVLSGFINGLFLVVIAMFVFVESVMRLFEPPEIKTDKLLIVSIAGLCVNLIGIFAFTHAHTHVHSGSHDHGHGHSHEHRHDSHENDNMKGVYLHILADTMSSVGIIISSFLVEQFGWLIADPLCSMFIAIMIFFSVRPLIKHSATVLLLRTPLDKEANFKVAQQKILQIDGVLSYRDEHLWQLSSSSYVTTLHVLVDANAYEQLVASQIHTILKDSYIANVTIQVEKEVLFNHLMGLGVNVVLVNDLRRRYQSNHKNQQLNTTNDHKFI